MSEIIQKLIAVSGALGDMGISSENAVSSFIGLTSAMSEGRKRWKSEILEQWQASFKMPRKKKKRVRKELLLDWSIANYDPFGFS